MPPRVVIDQEVHTRFDMYVNTPMKRPAQSYGDTLAAKSGLAPTTDLKRLSEDQSYFIEKRTCEASLLYW